jgi:hypothetical protein
VIITFEKIRVIVFVFIDHVNRVFYGCVYPPSSVPFLTRVSGTGGRMLRA